MKEHLTILPSVFVSIFQVLFLPLRRALEIHWFNANLTIASSPKGTSKLLYGRDTENTGKFLFSPSIKPQFSWEW